MPKTAASRRSRVGQPASPPATSADLESAFNSIVPREYQGAVLHALAEAIDLAHGAHPERWGVRLLDGGFMLSVGPHEVLQVHSSSPDLQVVGRGVAIPEGVRALEELWFSGDRDYFGKPDVGAYYPSNPGSEKVLVPFELVDQVFVRLVPALTQVIDFASTRPRNPQTRRMHMPEFVEFVGERVSRRLPQPAYFDGAA